MTLTLTLTQLANGIAQDEESTAIYTMSVLVVRMVEWSLTLVRAS